nr:MAG TPA: hypothetical protein [Caudoviricetes sp.]
MICTKTSAKATKEKTKVSAKCQYTCTNISAILCLVSKRSGKEAAHEVQRISTDEP